MPTGITIVGLGPGVPGLLTVEAQQVLQTAHEIHLRTRLHPTVAALPAAAAIHSFDNVYEQADSFDDVYVEIASKVVELGARNEGVVYAVPGHPLVGEVSVQHILVLAEKAGVPVRIVEGLSFVEPVCSLLKLDPLGGLQVADAMSLAKRHYPEWNPDLPLIVGQLYSRSLAADVKLVLMMAYPDDHEVVLVKGAGTKSPWRRQMPLYELDRRDELDHLTALLVPPLSEAGSVAAFQELVAQLRAPGGCPWDREQTHASLRPSLLEETYEVLQALDESDTCSLQEELGDLLLQILLHTQIAIEQGEFRMADVVAQVVAKLKHRHPHVFGEVQVVDSDDVLANWERIKSAEKEHEPNGGTFSGVPRSLPALARAQALLRRAARLGCARPDVAAVWSAADRYLSELHNAPDEEARQVATGELLFSVVDLAHRLGTDAEGALREAVTRFGRCAEERVGNEALQKGPAPPIH